MFIFDEIIRKIQQRFLSYTLDISFETFTKIYVIKNEKEKWYNYTYAYRTRL